MSIDSRFRAVTVVGAMIWGVALLATLYRINENIAALKQDVGVLASSAFTPGSSTDSGLLHEVQGLHGDLSTIEFELRQIRGDVGQIRVFTALMR